MNTLKKITFVLCILFITIIGIGPTPSSAADDIVFAPDSAPYGMTQGDWSAVWWQYIYSVPPATNPLFDPGPGQGFEGTCDVDQSTGPVFFLAGSWVGEVERECTIHGQKAIFLPLFNIECSTLEDEPFYGEDVRSLRTCAAGLADDIVTKDLKLTVDGKQVKHLDTFRFQSPVFEITLPKHDNLMGITSEQRTGMSVSDGYWVMLAPLPPGEHTVHFEGRYNGEVGDVRQVVTYVLDILAKE